MHLSLNVVAFLLHFLLEFLLHILINQVKPALKKALEVAEGGSLPKHITVYSSIQLQTDHMENPSRLRASSSYRVTIVLHLLFSLLFALNIVIDYVLQYASE